MNKPETKYNPTVLDQSERNARHREGVARRLDRLEAMVADLPVAVSAAVAEVLAERREQLEEQRRVND